MLHRSCTTLNGRSREEKLLAGRRNQSRIDQQFRAVQVLYFAMLASLLGYLVVGLAVGPTRAAETVTPPPSRAFYLLSLGLAAAAFFVKKQMVRPLLPGSSPAEIKGTLGSFRSGHLVSYVLCEGVGLVALVALFLVGSRIQFINLLVVAFALMVLLRPKRIDFSKL